MLEGLRAFKASVHRSVLVEIESEPSGRCEVLEHISGFPYLVCAELSAPLVGNACHRAVPAAFSTARRELAYRRCCRPGSNSTSISTLPRRCYGDEAVRSLPCMMHPATGTKVPADPGWLAEIKRDGSRNGDL
jgi:hypothetical protein